MSSSQITLNHRVLSCASLQSLQKQRAGWNRSCPSARIQTWTCLRQLFASWVVCWAPTIWREINSFLTKLWVLAALAQVESFKLVCMCRSISSSSFPRKTSGPGWCQPSILHLRSPSRTSTLGRERPTPPDGPQTARWLRSRVFSWNLESWAASLRSRSTRSRCQEALIKEKVPQFITHFAVSLVLLPSDGVNERNWGC